MKEVMDESKCTRDEAFARTMKTKPQEYSRVLKDMVRKCGDASSEKHVIFTDKNTPANAIDKA